MVHDLVQATQAPRALQRTGGGQEQNRTAGAPLSKASLRRPRVAATVFCFLQNNHNGAFYSAVHGKLNCTTHDPALGPWHPMTCSWVAMTRWLYSGYDSAIVIRTSRWVAWCLTARCAIMVLSSFCASTACHRVIGGGRSTGSDHGVR